MICILLNILFIKSEDPEDKNHTHTGYVNKSSLGSETIDNQKNVFINKKPLSGENYDDSRKGKAIIKTRKKLSSQKKPYNGIANLDVLSDTNLQLTNSRTKKTNGEKLILKHSKVVIKTKKLGSRSKCFDNTKNKSEYNIFDYGKKTSLMNNTTISSGSNPNPHINTEGKGHEDKPKLIPFHIDFGEDK